MTEPERSGIEPSENTEEPRSDEAEPAEDDEWPNESSLSGKLKNPHLTVAGGPNWIALKNRQMSLVEGDYHYFHYNHDGCHDKGWGCCYRGIQTLISWFLANSSAKAIPSLWKIQRLLQDKDPAHHELKVGTPRWIGTVEGGYVLNWYLGIECETLHIPSAAELYCYTDVLSEHFQNVKCPALIGVGEYAYVLAGVCTDANGRDDLTSYLIIDPHFTDKDDMNTILSKKAVAWKKADFLVSAAKGKFINICLPTTKQL